ncbi:MAG: DUF1127 domain-containing protein [Pseudomonadota bacterium]
MAHVTDSRHFGAVRPARYSIFAALRVWRQRQSLKSLDAHLLNDIGVTEQQALKEARRPIWDVPQTWRY